MFYQHPNMKSFFEQKGFTLIELLASMVVIMTIGVLVVTIIVSSLRGTNKTNAILQVKQNGSLTLNQMTKMIRDAATVESIGGVPVSNCFVSSGGGPTP